MSKFLIVIVIYGCKSQVYLFYTLFFSNYNFNNCSISSNISSTSSLIMTTFREIWQFCLRLKFLPFSSYSPLLCPLLSIPHIPISLSYFLFHFHLLFPSLCPLYFFSASPFAYNLRVISTFFPANFNIIRHNPRLHLSQFFYPFLLSRIRQALGKSVLL